MCTRRARRSSSLTASGPKRKKCKEEDTVFHINDNFQKLPGSYLFAEIARRVKEYQQAHPDADIIRLGIGDVTKPLVPAVIDAMHKAVEEMGHEETFRGYGPDFGYDFLVNAIREGDYASRGIDLAYDEVFVSDGAKCDVGNIQELFSDDAVIAVTDPVYPVYVDSNAMAGRAGDYVNDKWNRLVYLPCNAENGFVPPLPDKPVDVIYLCYPNNPTGMVITRDELRKWVNYAIHNDSIIFYDAAYEAFIRDENIPHSIYEIRGARKVAIEFHSYSKTAGFTGVRCGYTVVPKELTAATMDGNRLPLNPFWLRRQSTKFNGTSYISQRAAEAIYTPEGKRQTQATINYYMENARIMHEALSQLGFKVYGGTDAPYLWVKTPGNTPSWQFFEELLYGAQIVCTPGVGFGPSGEGFVRLTSFGDRANCIEAMERIRKWMNK